MLNQLLTRKQQWYVFYFAISFVFWVENLQVSKESDILMTNWENYKSETAKLDEYRAVTM
jgi:hypothetical protein